MTRLRGMTLLTVWLVALGATPLAIAQDVSLESGRTTVGGTLTRVVLDGQYTDPVVVCTVNYAYNTTPVIARVFNVTPSSFDVRLDHPGGGAVAAETVSYLVVEAGSWTLDGTKIDAWTYESTLTDFDGMWAGQAQSYLQDHTNPVVLGQVMSANDPDWSVFWCQGALLAEAPSRINLRTGKAVGEDPDRTRVNETIGIIVIDAGSGTLGGVRYEAAVGPDTIIGAAATPAFYTFTSTFDAPPQIALATMAGLDGNGGGWAQTHGASPTTATRIYLSIDEDQLGDDERSHTTEQVGYLVFEHATQIAMAQGAPCTSDDDCGDGIDCTIDRCIAGTCASAALDALCDNGQFCDGVEYCDGVSGCAAGTPPCTGGCVESTDQCTGCNADADCDDGVFCNGFETCVGGECVAGSTPCIPGYCLERYESCGFCFSHADCNDGLFCNGQEYCINASCRIFSQPCTGLCDENIDSCVTCLSDAECDNGVFCDGREMCDAGTCTPAAPLDCDDGILCTADTCNESLGACVNTPNDPLCDNGAYCDGTETCDPLFDCIPGSAPCPIACNEATDVCVACAQNGDCSDGLFCNGAELCVDGSCIAGTPPACDDGIACTLDSCNNAASACSHVPDHTLCDNGSFCDGLETCDADTGCLNGASPCTGLCDDVLDDCVECLGAADCDDGLYCTGTEACIAGTCVVESAVGCDDGVACTIDTCNELIDDCEHAPDDSLCDNGLFCDGTETCDALDGCLAGTAPCNLFCNDDSDTCSECLGDEDCDDGLFCTGVEICAAGTCIPGPAPDCDDGIACTVDDCDDQTDACAHAPDEAACSDGSFCNGLEICDPLLGCEAGAPPCSGLCDDVLDDCVDCLVDGHCDDGLYCNGAETCVAGTCQAGSPPICDDDTACTIDACDELTAGCSHTADDALCDNGQFCDGQEYCDPVQGCLVGVTTCDLACDEVADLCVECLSNANCDDGLFCNGAETCGAGVCQAGVPIDCADVVDCTVDTCNEDIDACVHAPDHAACDNGAYCDGTEQCDTVAGCMAGMAPCPEQCDDQTDQCVACTTGNDCDDGLVCNGTESCVAGACVAGTPLPCDDGITCTVDACSEQLQGCTHTPDDGLCDNGQFCDGNETCDSQAGCLLGTAPCAEQCDEAGDACVQCLEDGDCADDLFCNGSETCSGSGVCVPGVAVACDDTIDCTADTCDEDADACMHTPDHATCDNGLFCDGGETCDPQGGCTAGAAPCAGLCDEDSAVCVDCLTAEDCDDGIHCNGIEACVAGSCAEGVAIVCDDGVACTVDACDEAADGCSHTPDDTACDNGSFCDGVEHCDLLTGCISGPAPCPAYCDEQDDTCLACLDHADCDDGVLCNGIETCLAGACIPGNPPACDDGVPCTVDTCDGALDACVHTPTDALCDNTLFCDGVETCDSATGCVAGTPPCPGLCDDNSNACVDCLNDETCTDGLFCNGLERCLDGACTPGDPPACDDGVACSEDTCNEQLDECQSQFMHDVCDDGLFCNGMEMCGANGCTAGTAPCAILCDDLDDRCIECLVDADCVDGLVCNGAETCADGVCSPGTAPDCSDGIECTMDACQEPLGCQHIADDAACDNGVFCDGAETCAPTTGCTPEAPPCVDSCDEDADQCNGCQADADCDDGVFCNGAERCVDQACVPGTTPCIEGYCLEPLGSCGICSFDAQCNDGRYCNGTEYCLGGQCRPFGIPNCDDGIACTLDSCDDATESCVFTPDHGHCDNGMYCDGMETCIPGSGCAPGAAPSCANGCDEGTDGCLPSCQSDADCADGLACNGVETCQDGTCQAGTPLACDDGVACTTDTCSESSGCTHAPNNDACDNGLFCDGLETCDALAGCLAGLPPCAGDCIEASEACVECTTNDDCADGVFCNGVELCAGGLCVSGASPCAAGQDCDEDAGTCMESSSDPISLTLIDAAADTPIPAHDPLQNGAMIDVAALPPVTIAATVLDPPGSVIFTVREDGVLIYSHTENNPPYALFGDNPGLDYIAWPNGPTAGHVYQVTATAYSQSQGTGTAQQSVVVTFTTASGCTTTADCDDGLFCNGAELCSGGICQLGSPPCAGLACDEDTDACTASQGVVGLTLIDTVTNQPIPGFDPLVNGVVLNLAALPPVSVEAQTVPFQVGSVIFELKRDGITQLVRTENQLPYALFGDDDGDFNPWPDGGPEAGHTYQVTATSFSGAGGSGASDPPLTVAFTTTNACSVSADCDDGVYCNGVELCIGGTCSAGLTPCASGMICNESTDSCSTPTAQTRYVDDNGPAQPGYDPTAPVGSFNHPFSSAQAAADAAIPGDTFLFRTGTYISSSSAQAVPVLSITTSGVAGAPITFAAAPGETVVFSGQTSITATFIDIHAAYIDIAGFELTGARRAAIVANGSNSHHINVRMCHAHHNDYDVNWIGGAFRTVGPAHDILFEDCISNNNSGGFQLRESPNQTSGSASVPPIAGNTGFVSDLPEAQWDSWPGWTSIAARDITLRRCIAFDNRLIDEHSDGIALRYAIQCVFEDCIAFGNSDDGIDMLGATRCIARRNISFNNDPENTPNGDGNGIKIGVRGGLDNVAYGNISFDNERGGIDMADTERPVAYNNTVFNNKLWFGLWFEGGRSQVGATVFNNICATNPKGDLGFNGSVNVALADHNLLTDTNNHNWARPAGTHSFVGANPQFANAALTISTAFPPGSSIPAKHEYIRSQVHSKLGLLLSSPAVDAGMPWPTSDLPVGGLAPDMGALESN